MKTTILTNLTLINGTGSEPLEGAAIVIEGERIKEVLQGVLSSIPSAADRLDCQGQFAIPGLIDAHVHVGSTEPSIVGQHRMNFPSYSLLKSLKGMRETLNQGFTTVRDCGGADPGVRQALQEGLIPGPRMFVCGRILSQTGGHGDFRLPTENHVPVPYPGGVGSGIFDGPDEVRRGVREQLRQGVDFIKLMAGGGVASPSDEITNSQYSPEELRVAVYEAESSGTYVAAHCYAERSIVNCCEAGVRTIEHGNLLTETGAKAMQNAGACLVPTLVTYEMMLRMGKELNLPEFTLRKNVIALEKAYEAISIALKMGIKIGSGSDLLGPMRNNMGKELALQAQVLGPMGALVAATKTNAEVLKAERDLGTLEAGKLADILVVRTNPLDNLSVFDDYTNNISLILQGGEVYKSLL